MLNLRPCFPLLVVLHHLVVLLLLYYGFIGPCPLISCSSLLFTWLWFPLVAAVLDSLAVHVCCRRLIVLLGSFSLPLSTLLVRYWTTGSFPSQSLAPTATSPHGITDSNCAFRLLLLFMSSLGHSSFSLVSLSPPPPPLSPSYSSVPLPGSPGCANFLLIAAGLLLRSCRRRLCVLLPLLLLPSTTP